MATITDFQVPIEQFALADTFARIPDLYVEIERFAAQESASAIPFVWVTSDDFEAFEAALSDDPSVDSYTALAEFDDERFYRMNWVDEVELVVHLLLEEEGAITQARSNGDTWSLQVMFPDHDSLSRTYEFCEENGLALTVDSIYRLDNEDKTQFGLTESQYRTLAEAKDMGYYDVPREATMSELADSLDVSHQALSERLRRAHGNLVDRALSASNAKQEERGERQSVRKPD
ncbi:helix-turn-helix domain-containing protein [Halalkalicoccus sp. NIPERK01]|uniref:helix-turn-helix domain-containing protein n=1 Tax=Halalkalicoccus sp. NIPERK01 TaxID=3053469 RepID=UPI00256EA881|nr:helix-turn-helix domain-containing protein [Halalkalicoccus sp. NIPERK01]MDL5362198.1 helix-turn-helix domain-containing protein [Halalkalicoccus sp. NIPERK01]